MWEFLYFGANLYAFLSFVGSLNCEWVEWTFCLVIWLDVQPYIYIYIYYSYIILYKVAFLLYFGLDSFWVMFLFFLVKGLQHFSLSLLRKS